MAICIDYSVNPPVQFTWNGGSTAWGSITGTLSAQSDLQTALNAKAAVSSLAAVALDGQYSSLLGIPSTFTPAAHTHAAADIISGVFAMARLATGTPTGSKFIRDDGVLAVPAGGGGATITTAVLALPYASCRQSVVVTDAVVTPSSKIVLSLGPMLDTDVNADDDIDLLSLQAIAGTGSFTARLNFLTPIGGNLSINYMVA